MNSRIRMFLTVASVAFAVLLVIYVGRTILLPGDRPASTVGQPRVVDRPAESPAATTPPRTHGRSLIRQTVHLAAAPD